MFKPTLGQYSRARGTSWISLSTEIGEDLPDFPKHKQEIGGDLPDFPKCKRSGGIPGFP